MKNKRFIIITTKKVYYTDDTDTCNKIKDFFTKVDYGKMPPFPFLKDIKVAINPKYVVSIELNNLYEENNKI